MDKYEVMDIFILAIIFFTPIKFTIWTFILQCISILYLKVWDIAWLMFKKIKMLWMNEIWVKFIVW
jgi:hypothetical protein